MKCAQHPLEDGVGVCAACLRDRLLSLAAVADRKPSPNPPSPGLRRLHRSVSPSARRATAGGPRPSSVFSILLDRHGRGDREGKPQKSRSWLPGLLHGRRTKKNTPRQGEAAALERARGMSPESSGGDCEAEPSYRKWHPTPSPMKKATAEQHRHRHHNAGAFAGIAMCFSPRVTVSPRCRRSRTRESSSSDEIQRAAFESKHRRPASAGSEEPALWHNCSRKLVDFGRFR
ncbi:hypothetical protein Cni_G07651 [Canna indica]|uniref:Uncharacterized protein n=1 Tax=Canna indica TaxID=4628 RepID=A0AAQ3K0Q8_9LILI|nr:hypothetical protein Cni_G07651 [Canna indica]